MGSWKENQKDGFGELIWDDGKRYEGMFSNDIRHGYGSFYWKDGRVYEGSWNLGK